MAILPKDVVLRISTITNEAGELFGKKVYTKSKKIPSMSESPSYGCSKISLKQIQDGDKLAKLLDKSNVEYYKEGKADAYTFIIKQFDACKTVTDVYKAVNAIRKELESITAIDLPRFNE